MPVAPPRPDRRPLNPLIACIIAAAIWLAFTGVGGMLGMFIGGSIPCDSSTGTMLKCLLPLLYGAGAGAAVGVVLGTIAARLLHLRWWFAPVTLVVTVAAWFIGERVRVGQIFWATYALAPFVSALLSRPRGSLMS